MDRKTGDYMDRLGGLSGTPRHRILGGPGAPRPRRIGLFQQNPQETDRRIRQSPHAVLGAKRQFRIQNEMIDKERLFRCISFCLLTAEYLGCGRNPRWLDQNEAARNEGGKVGAVGSRKPAPRLNRAGRDHGIHAETTRPARRIEQTCGGRSLGLLESDHTAREKAAHQTYLRHRHGAAQKLVPRHRRREKPITFPQLRRHRLGLCRA